MRKSFTWLLSFIMLFCMVSFMAVGADTTPPSVVTNGPSGVDVLSGSSFTVTFTEPVKVASGSGVVGLYDVDNSNVQLEAISVTNPLPTGRLQLSADGKTLTIKFGVPTGSYQMKEDHNYYITITGDAFQDDALNRFPGMNSSVWVFKTGDYTAPTLAAVYPTANVLAGTLTLAPTLKIKFDDKMLAGAGNVTLYKVGANGQGTLVQVIPAASFSNLNTIEPTFALTALTELGEYYVRVDADAFRDDAAVNFPHTVNAAFPVAYDATKPIHEPQYFGGISNSTSWKFKVADVTSPLYSGAVPSPAVATDVAKNGKIIFTFTDNRTNFVLQKTTGAPVTVAPIAMNEDVSSKFSGLGGGSAKYVGDNKVEISAPAAGWASKTTYTVNVFDATFFADAEKNNAVIGAGFSFTAGDFDAPVFTAAVAPSLPTNTKIDLSVTVTTESTFPVTAYYYVVKSADAQPTAFNAATWTKIDTDLTALVPSVTVANIDKDFFGATLASGTAYKVYVVADDAEATQNNFSVFNAAPSPLTVTTSDVVAPTVEYVKFATDYTDEATYTATATALDKAMYVVVKFNETISPVTSAAAAIEIKKGDSDQTTFDFVGQVGANKLVYRIKDAETGTDYAPSFWRSKATYTVKVLADQVKDASLAGNLYAGNSAASFTIGDFEGPNPVYSFGSTYTNLDNATANGKLDVPTTSTITIDLGEQAYVTGTTLLDNSNLVNHLFFRLAGGGAFVPATATISNNQVITIVPTPKLLQKPQSYTIELTSTLKDGKGNKMGYYETSGSALPGFTNELITFTTADETSPLITLTPGNGVSGRDNNVALFVSINDVVYLNNGDALNTSDANFLRPYITLTKVSDGSSVKFDIAPVTVGTPSTFSIIPFANFEASQSYTLAVTGLYDSALPNKNSASASSTFSIREYTAPVIVANGLTPAKDAKYVAAAGTVSIQFNEPVIAGAGNVTITNETTSGTEVVPVGSLTFNAANNTVTIPHAAFVTLQKYHITFPAGVIKDAVGNNFGGITSATDWAFSAFDTTPPALASTLPADNDGAVYPKPSKLVLNFTEASNIIKANGGYVYVNNNSNTRILQISSNSSNVSITNNAVTITVDPSIFNYGESYWIEVESSAFRDDAGNAFAGFMGIGNIGVWNFTIGADQAPWITALTPANNADRVNPNTTLKITFSEPVRLSASAKQLNIYNLNLGLPGFATAIYTSVVNSANTTLNNGLTGTEATITLPAGSLVSNIDYEVRILAAAFEDVDGTTNDALYAIDGSSYVSPFKGWKFTTKDNTAPVVTFTVPSSTTGILPADFVANNSNIVVRFDETVAIPTPATAVTLTSGTYAATFVDNTLVINPDADFGSLAVPTVTLVAGAVKDLSGNPAVGTITFTAADNVKPTWTTVPGSVAAITATGCTVTMQMSEAGKVFYQVGGTAPATAAALIANKTGELVVTGGSDVLTIAGLTPDVANTIYFVGQDVPKPTANVMDDANIKSVSVLTKDNIAPLLYAITDYAGGLKPADGATCVLKTSTLELSFNDDMAVVDASKVWVRQLSDNHSVNTPLTVTSPAGSKKIIITLTGTLTEKAEYYVEINPGAFSDESANVWGDNFYGNSRWNFTVADQTAPAFVAVGTPPSIFSPADDAIVGNNNPTLTMNFNEPIQKGAGFIYIYRTLNPSADAQEIINVTNADVVVSNDEKSVSFPLHNALSEKVNYYVTFAAGVIKDKACTPNSFAGIPDVALPGFNTTWNFIGKDITVPSIYAVNTDGATNIATVGTSTIIEFTEVVQKSTGGTLDAAYVKSKLTADNGLDLTGAGVTVTVNDAYVTTLPYTRTVTQVTLTGIPYLSQKAYTFTWAANSVKDDAGLTNTAAKSWTVTTRDDLAPYVQLWTPTPTVAGTPPVTTNPVDQAIRQVVTITFDDAVIFNNNITIDDTNVDGLIAFEKVTGGVATVNFDAIISADKTKITITPTDDLKALYEYKVTLKTGTVPSDLKLKAKVDIGNPVALLLNTDQTLNFTVKDHAAPVAALASTFVPADNATNVTTLTGPLEIKIQNYDAVAGGLNAGAGVVETMKAGTGNVNIYRANGTVFDVIAASSCNFATAGTIKIPLLASLPLEPYTSYYVNFLAGTFTDLAGNSLAGVAGSTAWNFATHDDRGPYPLSLNPVNGGTDVPVFANLKIYFSENINPATLAGKISIYNKTNNTNDDGNWVEDIAVAGARVVLSGSDVANGKTTDVVTIDPLNDFSSTGRYYIRIDANAFSDTDGNTWRKNLASSTAAVGTGFDSYNDWWFDNSDNTVPNPISWNPTIGSVVPVSQSVFTLGFNRTIATGAGKIRLYEYVLNPTTLDRDSYLVDAINASAATVVNGTDLTFSFTKPLVETKSWYYINIDNGAVTNTAASHDGWVGYVDPNSWKFSTDDNTRPTISSIVPVSGANDLTNNVNFVVTFDEPIVANAGAFKLYNKADDVLVSTVLIANAVITNGNVVSFTVSGLKDKTSYYLLIDAAIVNDDAVVANSFAGVTDKTTYEYTVKDNNAPTLAIPANVGTVATNVFTVALAFNEEVAGVDAASVTVNNGATVVVTGAGAAYEAVVTAQSNTAVTMTVANTIKDLADFNFAGTTFLFNVSGDQVKPAVVSLNPADGSIGIVRKPELGITFNKPVVKGSATAKVKVYKQDVSNTNNLVFETVIDDSMISADGPFLTIPVTEALADNSDYVVIVDAGIVKSLSGLTFDGLTSPTDWNLRTGDNTSPVVLSITPNTLSAAKNNFNVSIEFSEDVVNVAENISVTNGTVSVTGSGKMYVAAISGDDGADIDMTIGTGVMDASERNNMTTAEVRTYTVGDNTAPTVVVTPDSGNNMTNAFNVALQFSEPVVGVADGVVVSGGNVVVTGSGVNYLVSISGAVDMSNVVLTLPNSISDMSGNAYAGPVHTFTYRVGDNTAPTVVATPADGTNNLASNFQVTLAFNEDVVVPDGGITVTGATSSQSHVGNVYTVNVSGVDDNSVVLVNLSNSIKDIVGNAFVAQTLTYNTKDNTTPTLIVTDPLTPIAKTFTVGLTFSEAVIMPATLPASAITNGTLVAINGSGANYQLTITAAEKAVVRISIPNSITDLAGNMFAGQDLPPYTIGDFTGPIVTAAPASGTNLAKTFPVVLTFSDDAIVTHNDITVTGAISHTVSHVGNVYTVNVTAADNSTVTITAAANIADAASNYITGVRSFTYTTGDTTAPVIITVNPNGGATADAHPVSFDIFVNELVVNGTGKLVVYKKAGDVKTMEIDITKATIGAATGSAYKVSLPLSASLDKFTEYYVLLPEGLVADASGNKLASVTSKAFWTFKTGDFLVPVVNLNDASLFKVYPNPFVEYVNVDNASLLSKIVVTNIVGQTVKEVVNPTDRIQLNELRSGVYFISLYDMDNVIAKTAKIVKR